MASRRLVLPESFWPMMTCIGVSGSLTSTKHL